MCPLLGLRPDANRVDSSLLQQNDFDVMALTASNVLTNTFVAPHYRDVRHDPVRWQQLLDLEQRAASSPGCVDMGTHIIAAAVKRPIARL